MLGPSTARVSSKSLHMGHISHSTHLGSNFLTHQVVLHPGDKSRAERAGAGKGEAKEEGENHGGNEDKKQTMKSPFL